MMSRPSFTAHRSVAGPPQSRWAHSFRQCVYYPPARRSGNRGTAGHGGVSRLETAHPVDPGLLADDEHGEPGMPGPRHRERAERAGTRSSSRQVLDCGKKTASR